MHGGLKLYRGSPAAARSYVEADHSRADDYYLAEGTGLAERYVASPTAGVGHAGTLTGDAYEAWVAGCDPDTGAAKGRLRNDPQAVRFVEVVVNGPKSWSLAAALHPDVGAAYDAAQDRAAQQVIGWLAEHATTRVGPRGRQVQVPVAEIEAVTVRHYTSRAGDPHRHLHLQVNARVFAEGGWRGLHTIGVRDSLDALNGIGHAAVMTDPGFRAALAAHGFRMDPTSGEVVELAGFVGPFSARAAQIARNVDRYEAGWRAANPGAEPDRRLRRSWDSRAWAEQRPDKVVPTDGTALAQRWVEELWGLGYRDPEPSPGRARPIAAAVAPPTIRVGELDRERAVADVVTRLGARRSGWNGADVRGEVERLIASTGILTEAPARLELAEDLTARTLAACVPLLGHRGVPEHVRALTSQQVLDVEADLTARFLARTTAPSHPRPTSVPASVSAAEDLDAGQAGVVTAMVDDYQRLLVVEGAAGAGKTTTLMAARAALEIRGRRLVVVTPTLQAATVAAEQVRAPAFSAAWLAHQHGYRWTTDGAWTRLRVGDPDPATGATYRGPQPGAVLAAGDLLLVDEAGMLDQDTARALMVIADEHRSRVTLVGDRHQLPAVGRGGVLDLAARWADPEACLSLEAVHRFRDPAYAQLSLAMRTGKAPGQPGGEPVGQRRGEPVGQRRGGPRGKRGGEVAGLVFDALVARGEVRTYPSQAERTAALAQLAARAVTAGTGGRGGGGGRDRVLVVADTREQVAELNAAIRDRLVTGGQVEDSQVVTTRAGERIGVGDQIATRRNDRVADVANRDTWRVTGLGPDGSLAVSGRRGDRVLSGAYVHHDVELGYASTVYGAQGATTGAGHLVLGEHTGAAAAYVAMTRGRDSNTAHIVAEGLDGARDQWIGAFSRDRADLGPAHAARLAAAEASGYAHHRRLGPALADLTDAWTREHGLVERLNAAQERRDQLAEIVALRADRDTALAEHSTAWTRAARGADQARERVEHLEGLVSSDTERIAGRLHQEWDSRLPTARQAAETLDVGGGVFGQRRGAVRRAADQLDAWGNLWRPILSWLPTETRDVAIHARGYLGPSLGESFLAHARRVAEAAHPELPLARAAATTASGTATQAFAAYQKTESTYQAKLANYGALGYLPHDPACRLADTERDVAELTDQLHEAHARVRHALAEPAIRSLPPERIETERERWAADRAQNKRQQQQVRTQAAALAAHSRRGGNRPHEPSEPYYSAKPPSPGIGR